MNTPRPMSHQGVPLSSHQCLYMQHSLGHATFPADPPPPPPPLPPQDGKTLENELEVVEGMKFDRGYISPYFVTDQKTMKAELENPLILIVEKKVSGLASILPVLEKVVQVSRGGGMRGGWWCAVMHVMRWLVVRCDACDEVVRPGLSLCRCWTRWCR